MVTILAIIYVVFISLGLPDSLFGVAWPVVHKEFMVAESFASIYSIITGVCTGGISLIAGKLIRKFGTPNVTFVSVLLTATGLLGISFAPNIIVMMIFTIIMGYGAGAIDTALNNYISLHYEARHMSWLHCFWGVGVTVSPLVMSIFLDGDNGTWRNGYRVISIMQFAIAFLVLLSIKKWKTFDDKTNNLTETDNKNSKKLNIFKTKGLITSILSQGLYCSMEFLIGTWGASFLVNSHALAPNVAAKWVSLYYGGIMLGRLISGFISFKASDNTLIRGGIVTAFSGIVILALPLGSFSFLGLLLIGIGFGPIFPSILHSVPDRFGKDFSADITGYHMGGAYAIGFLVQLTFGYVATATTFNITPYILLLFITLLFIDNEFTLQVLRKHKLKGETQ